MDTREPPPTFRGQPARVTTGRDPAGHIEGISRMRGSCGVSTPPSLETGIGCGEDLKGIEGERYFPKVR